MKNRQKIGVLVDSIDVDRTSGAKANVSLIKNLVSLGYSVHIYHYSDGDIHLEGIDCIKIKEDKGSIFYFLSRTERVLRRKLNIRMNGFLERIMGFSFTFFNDVKSMRSVISRLDPREFDLLITLSQGASFRPHYVLLKLPRWHTKWLAYIHDPYPFKRYPDPYSWDDPGAKKKERVMGEIARNAGWSAFPSVLLRDWMSGFYPRFEEGVIIPHQLTPAASEENVKALIEEDQFVLIHGGHLMKQRDPSGLLQGFTQLIQRSPKFAQKGRLYLIGGHDYHKEILDAYTKGYGQIIVKEKIPFAQMKGLQARADVNIIIEADAELSPFLPGKFPHCIVSGRPVLYLGPKHSETYRLLGTNYPHHAGVSQPEEIADRIESLFEQWRLGDNKASYDQEELLHYLGPDHLRKIMDSILYH